MTGMNRLSPWIVRRQRPLAVALAPPASMSFDAPSGPVEWVDDARLFLTGWVGGLIFFGTLIG